MSYSPLSPIHAVAPQISPQDVADLKDAGFTKIICNRPDGENPVELQAEVLRAAAEAAGLTFAVNPVIGGAMTMENVQEQASLLADPTEKTLAYCASGTRCAILWALANAGKIPTEEILTTLRSAGYQLDGLRGQIDMFAAQKS